MSIGKQNRALLIVSYLERSNKEGWESWLYPWLQENAVDLTETVLSNNYARTVSLEGVAARFDSFLQTITDLTARDEIKALDVCIHLHGTGSGALRFYEELVTPAHLQESLQSLPHQNKLRACYSTACYAAKNVHAWVNGGFFVASGAIGVNTNAAVELPVFLSGWEDGETFGSLVQKGCNNPLTVMFDKIGKNKGFRDANSRKVIVGQYHTRITTDPRAMYKISLVTGNINFAGTDAKIRIRFHSNNEESSRFLLNNPGNPNEKGDTDIYFAKMQDLGNLTAITIEHDNSGPFPGWFLQEVRVKNLKTGRAYFTPAMRWFACDEPPYQLKQKLPLLPA